MVCKIISITNFISAIVFFPLAIVTNAIFIAFIISSLITGIAFWSLANTQSRVNELTRLNFEKSQHYERQPNIENPSSHIKSSWFKDNKEKSDTYVCKKCGCKVSISQHKCPNCGELD